MSTVRQNIINNLLETYTWEDESKYRECPLMGIDESAYGK